ncbi:MAG: hypothetical protein ACJ72I_08750 [Pseudonocardiaceae bacterium]
MTGLEARTGTLLRGHEFPAEADPASNRAALQGRAQQAGSASAGQQVLLHGGDAAFVLLDGGSGGI